MTFKQTLLTCIFSGLTLAAAAQQKTAKHNRVLPVALQEFAERKIELVQTLKPGSGNVLHFSGDQGSFEKYEVDISDDNHNLVADSADHLESLTITKFAHVIKAEKNQAGLYDVRVYKQNSAALTRPTALTPVVPTVQDPVPEKPIMQDPMLGERGAVQQAWRYAELFP